MLYFKDTVIFKIKFDRKEYPRQMAHYFIGTKHKALD